MPFYFKLGWSALVMAVPFILGMTLVPMRWERITGVLIGIVWGLILFAVSVFITGMWVT